MELRRDFRPRTISNGSELRRHTYWRVSTHHVTQKPLNLEPYNLARCNFGRARKSSRSQANVKFALEATPVYIEHVKKHLFMRLSHDNLCIPVRQDDSR